MPRYDGVAIFTKRLYKSEILDQTDGDTKNWTNPWGGKSYISLIETWEEGTPGFLQTINNHISHLSEIGIDKINVQDKNFYSLS